jgi:hypothetical protein
LRLRKKKKKIILERFNFSVTTFAAESCCWEMRIYYPEPALKAKALFGWSFVCRPKLIHSLLTIS